MQDNVVKAKQRTASTAQLRKLAADLGVEIKEAS